MAGDLCRFAHEADELSDAAAAWVSTSGVREPGASQAVSAVPLESESEVEKDVALRILKELEVRANQLSRQDASSPGAGTMSASSSRGPRDPWRQRQQMLSQEYAMIEESILMLQRYKFLQPAARAQLFRNLRHLPQLRGDDLTTMARRSDNDNDLSTMARRGDNDPRLTLSDVEAPPFPRFLKQDQTPSGSTADPMGLRSYAPPHNPMEVEEMARMWRNLQTQEVNVSSSFQAVPEAEAEELQQRLKIMTQFFAENLNSRPR